MPTRRQFLFQSSSLAVLASAASGCMTPGAGVGQAGRFDLDDLAQRTFQWFWDTGDAKTGLVPDRWPTPSFASIAAVGFGLTCYAIGAARGWITREQARERTLATMRFFDTAKQGPEATGTAGHKGFFYHFLDMKTGTRFGKTELSSVDTTLLFGGMLFSAQWFDGAHPEEVEIRTLANRIVGRADWRWMLGKGPYVSMGWHPETGHIPHTWDRYNEAMLLYILAFASDDHGIDPKIWTKLTKDFERSWGVHWGEEHLHFPPLFGHQYSHCWIDFRGIRDPYIESKGIDYFENSRRAVKAQRNYAIANPKGWAGYGENVWGLTACDGPGDFKAVIGGREREFHSYSARGPDDRDDGTLAPTAAAASIAFAPELVEPCLAEMNRRYGSAIMGQYGFWDSFNPTLTSDPPHRLQHGKVMPGVCWVDGDYLGIDQGPILIMIANHQQDFVWRTMRGCPVLTRGLKKAGFAGGWLA